MSDEWIKASELADYVYCRRAWWLRRVNGLASENLREMQAGQIYHRQHGQLVKKAVWAQRAVYVLVFLAVFFIAFQMFLGF